MVVSIDSLIVYFAFVSVCIVFGCVGIVWTYVLCVYHVYKYIYVMPSVKY